MLFQSRYAFKSRNPWFDRERIWVLLAIKIASQALIALREIGSSAFYIRSLHLES